MISYKSAFDLVLQNVWSLGVESIPLDASDGFVLAEDIFANEDIPLFSASAVDGFAVHYEEIFGASEQNPALLPLVGTLKAGDFQEGALQTGTCVKIMTGAPIPDGTSAVVMREFTEEAGENVRFFRAVKVQENIRPHGQEFRAGACALRAGTRISPPIIALLASLGCATITVFRKPKVAVIVTGNELQDLDKPLARGEIRDSNSYALSAILRANGYTPTLLVRVRDEPEELRSAISDALDCADVVISTGGVSVGDYDFAKEIFGEFGVETVFWKAAIKPGKPTFFGIKAEKAVFGLPGNPVAVFITFELFVKAALLKMSGWAVKEPTVFQAKLLKSVRKKAGRIEFLRATLKVESGELCVLPENAQDSHLLSGIANANALIVFEQDAEFLSENSLVSVIQYPIVY